MEWYIPITIIPAVGLLILSTSNFLIALNNEITELEKDQKRYETAILRKLKQLKRLSIAIVFQYISVFLFLLAGISNALYMEGEAALFVCMLLAVLCITISIIYLLIFAIKAVTIRQQHLKL